MPDSALYTQYIHDNLFNLTVFLESTMFYRNINHSLAFMEKNLLGRRTPQKIIWAVHIKRHLYPVNPSGNCSLIVLRAFNAFRGPSRPNLLQSSSPRPLLSSHWSGQNEENIDIFPRITTHPALSSIQIRCGPRNTFSPSHFVRKRRHGFLSRISSRKGRATLLRRKTKKRSTLSH